MKKKTLFAAMLLITAVAVATELPGYDPVDRVIPKTDIAIVGKLVTVTNAQTKSDNVLRVTIEPLRSVWGQMPSNTIAAVYKEFIPVLPNKPGLNVDFINYTGSGIEFQAKAGEEFVCLLQKKQDTFILLRLETKSNESVVRDLFKKQKEEAPTTGPTVPPSAGASGGQ